MSSAAARLARWLLDRLHERDTDGVALAPGAAAAVRLPEPDGRQLALVARGEGLDVYFAGARDVVSFSVTRRTALAAAWFIVWRWCILATWCGLKLWLWSWATRTTLEGRTPRPRTLPPQTTSASSASRSSSATSGHPTS